MSIPQLQHAAIAPYLWKQRISKNVVQDLDRFYEDIEASPFEERYIAPEPLWFQTWYNIGDAFLVPGGRFVISAAGYHGSIVLYDLGFPRELQTTGRRKLVVSAKVGQVPDAWQLSVSCYRWQRLRTVLSREFYETKQRDWM